MRWEGPRGEQGSARLLGYLGLSSSSLAVLPSSLVSLSRPSRSRSRVELLVSFCSALPVRASGSVLLQTPTIAPSVHLSPLLLVSLSPSPSFSMLPQTYRSNLVHIRRSTDPLVVELPEPIPTQLSACRVLCRPFSHSHPALPFSSARLYIPTSASLCSESKDSERQTHELIQRPQTGQSRLLQDAQSNETEVSLYREL